MEEPIPTRYVFVMLLAIADPSGHVIGTDVAIARRINMPLTDFTACIRKLMEADPHSNSQEEDGRRILSSDGERGYRIVNYLTYRSIRDENDRREYMREYMKKYRAVKPVTRSRSKPVNTCKLSKPPLAQAEEELRVNHSVHADGQEEPPKRPRNRIVNNSPAIEREPIHAPACDCLECRRTLREPAVEYRAPRR